MDYSNILSYIRKTVPVNSTQGMFMYPALNCLNKVLLLPEDCIGLTRIKSRDVCIRACDIALNIISSESVVFSYNLSLELDLIRSNLLMLKKLLLDRDNMDSDSSYNSNNISRSSSYTSELSNHVLYTSAKYKVLNAQLQNAQLQNTHPSNARKTNSVKDKIACYINFILTLNTKVFRLSRFGLEYKSECKEPVVCRQKKVNLNKQIIIKELNSIMTSDSNITTTTTTNVVVSDKPVCDETIVYDLGSVGGGCVRVSATDVESDVKTQQILSVSKDVEIVSNELPHTSSVYTEEQFRSHTVQPTTNTLNSSTLTRNTRPPHRSQIHTSPNTRHTIIYSDRFSTLSTPNFTRRNIVPSSSSSKSKQIKFDDNNKPSTKYSTDLDELVFNRSCKDFRSIDSITVDIPCDAVNKKDADDLLKRHTFKLPDIKHTYDKKVVTRSTNDKGVNSVDVGKLKACKGALRRFFKGVKCSCVSCTKRRKSES